MKNLIWMTTVFLYVNLVAMVTTQITPQNITDQYGNYANASSHITWVIPPSGDLEYKSESNQNDLDPSLDVIVDMATDFVEILTPDDLPYDTIQEILDGSYDYEDKYVDILTTNIGLIFCVLIGLVFIVVCPLIGLFLCCCRMSQNCGGEMVHKNEYKGLRWCYICTLSIVTVLLAAGMVCTYVTGVQMTTSIDDIKETVHNALDDLLLYIKRTVDEIVFLGLTDFKFVSRVIYRHLDNIDNIVGQSVYNNLNDNVNVEGVIASVMKLDQELQNVSQALLSINSSLTALMTSAALLTQELSEVKNSIEAAQSVEGCRAECLVLETVDLYVDLELETLPDMSPQMSKIEELQNNNLTDLALQGRKEFDNIPQRVKNETLSVVDDIKNEIKNFEKSVDDNMEPVRNLSNEATEVETIRKDLDDTFETADEFDSYRFIPAIILSCLVLVVVLLQLIGLFCGVLGYVKEATPTERSKASDFGGFVLLGASGLIFIFAWLLMFLTTAAFILGAPLKSFLCDPLTDPNYEIFQKILDKPGGVFDDYFLGRTLLGNGSIPLTFSGVLEGCRLNGPAYQVLMLDNIFNLTEIVDYKESIDIPGKLSSLNVNLKDIKILSPDTQSQLQNAKDGVDIDYQLIIQVLSTNTTGTNLSDFVFLLQQASDTSIGPAKTYIDDATSILQHVVSNILPVVQDMQMQIIEEVMQLETISQNISDSIDFIIHTANQTDQYIHDNGNNVIKKAAADYAIDILNIADSYVNNTFIMISNEVARCRPLWLVWEAMVHKAMCTYLADVLNAFWFSLGWCVFFMVISLIINIKLAKYFRTMKYEADGSKPDINIQSSNRVSPISK